LRRARPGGPRRADSGAGAGEWLEEVVRSTGEKMQRLTDNDLDALEAAVKVYNETGVDEVDFDALPALLAEVRELRRRTTPEPIGEKHRDGNWWLVWEPGVEGWFKCRCRRSGDWQKSGTTERLMGTPTHALPLPGRPNEHP